MNLSKYFTLEEMYQSETAIRKGIDNYPYGEPLFNLKKLCLNLLDPLRDQIKQPIYVSSGFRCVKVNAAIGGAKNSQHTKGLAADIKVSGMSVENFYQFIKNSGLKYDQLIQEFDAWVHISYSDTPRGECLRATKQNSKTVYTKD
ncbi:MAG TPA: D-Ala-D-Ala carboxypeptidase family metallohydrolase [Bacteroidia bacterium]|nr:D-Ala-D-Ala carboxypeptidase family metallohydrolase [Bacteroidia bacterium]